MDGTFYELPCESFISSFNNTLSIPFLHTSPLMSIEFPPWPGVYTVSSLFSTLFRPSREFSEHLISNPRLDSGLCRSLSKFTLSSLPTYQLTSSLLPVLEWRWTCTTSHSCYSCINERNLRNVLTSSLLVVESLGVKGRTTSVLERMKNGWNINIYRIVVLRERTRFKSNDLSHF